MAETTASTPAPRKRRSWLKIIGWIVGVLVVLILVAYFVGTSAAFLKGVILPKVSAALNAKITVSDASISPFHEVVLKDLKVQPNGQETLVTAPEVRLRYSLMDIIGGNYHVEDITLSSPTIVLVQNPDKTSNLDPIMKKLNEKPSQPKPQPSKPAKPMQVDIGKVTITEGHLRQVQLYSGGHQDVTEISHLNLNVSNVKNGATGKLGLDAELGMQKNPPAPGTNGALTGTIEGNFDFALTAALKPESVKGNTKLTVTHTSGSLADAAGLGGTLDCDLTSTEIRKVALSFAKGNTRLAQLLVTGPFDMDKSEGRIKVELLNVDKNLLNIAGASSGIDFGPTTINSTNEVQLGNGGKTITTTGQFNLNQLTLTRTNQSTPPLDLHANYDVKVDSGAGNALLRTFTLTGSQKGNQFLRSELTSPMTFSWGGNANAVGNSTLSVAISHFNLADWKTFLGDVAPAGDVNAKLQLVSQQAGKQLGFDLDSKIDQLTAGSGSNQLTQLTVSMSLKGQATDLKQFKFPDYKLSLARQNQELLTASGGGTYDQTAGTADLQLNAQLLLARLLQALPRPDMKVTSGTADLKLHITQAPAANGSSNTVQTVTGSFALSDFTGSVGSNNFRSFATTADVDVTMTPQRVQIRKVAGQLAEGNNRGGAFNLSGTYDRMNSSSQLTAQLNDFNQNGLRPFLEPMLSGKQLTSVALNANASVQYDPNAASSVKAALQVTNLVVHDPEGQFPTTPLAAAVDLDTSLNKQAVDIRQCQLSLTPTDRAANKLALTGHVDMSDTNAYTGNLKLAADSLDFTTYYDLFGGSKTTAQKTGAPGAQPRAATPPATAGPEQEPEAKQLPFRNFTADAAIGRLYLHEVAITNFQMTTRLDGGKVALNPCKLTLNGAPVDTTINADLGVKGYKYDFAFNADTVPLAPLVNSFEPERKGQLGGTFTAHAKLGGQGTTGPNLKKYLNGQFDFGSTNLNLRVVDIRSPMLKTLINVIAIIPELTKNPESAVGGLLGSLVTSKTAGQTGGLAGELEKSPIDKVIAQGNIEAGKMDLQKATVQSPAFEANATGTIMLADILTNSTLNIPVSISLSHSLAERVNLVPVNAPTNQTYVPLPNFFTMKGTVGEPKQDINYRALAGTVFRGISGIIPGAAAGGKTGQIMQGLNGILGGANQAPANNATPAPNQSGGVGNVLKGLGIGGTGTNAPPQQPPATNQNPVNNLLKGIFK